MRNAPDSSQTEFEMKKYYIFVSPRNLSGGMVAGSRPEKIFDSKDEAKNYCRVKNELDPNSFYTVQEIEDQS